MKPRCVRAASYLTANPAQKHTQSEQTCVCAHSAWPEEGFIAARDMIHLQSVTLAAYVNEARAQSRVCARECRRLRGWRRQTGKGGREGWRQGREADEWRPEGRQVHPHISIDFTVNVMKPRRSEPQTETLPTHS